MEQALLQKANGKTHDYNAGQRRLHNESLRNGRVIVLKTELKI